MKQLYRVDVEFYSSDTVTVLADSPREARQLGADNADDTLDVEVSAREHLIQTPADIPEGWKDEFPVSDGVDEDHTCLQWFAQVLSDKTELLDPQQLWLGEQPSRKNTDAVDKKCHDYAALLRKIQTEDYTDEELLRCYKLSHDPDVQSRLEEARRKDLPE